MSYIRVKELVSERRKCSLLERSNIRLKCIGNYATRSLRNSLDELAKDAYKHVRLGRERFINENVFRNNIFYTVTLRLFVLIIKRARVYKKRQFFDA